MSNARRNVYDRRNRLEIATWSAGGVAVGSIGLAIYFWLAQGGEADSNSRANSARFTVQPRVSPHSAGMSYELRF